MFGPSPVCCEWECWCWRCWCKETGVAHPFKEFVLWWWREACGQDRYAHRPSGDSDGRGHREGETTWASGPEGDQAGHLASLFAEINTIQHELLSLISSKHERISPSRSVFNSIPASEKMLPMLHYSSPPPIAVLMPFSLADSGVPPCKSSLFIEY